jgi:hypothetical protein
VKNRPRTINIGNERVAMNKLIALKITKTQLEAIPKDDRLFYFLAGQVINDLNVLGRLLLAARNEVRLAGDEVAKRTAATAQLMLLLKLTAGRLYEAHKLINQSFSAKGFLSKYKNELPSATLETLKRLNRYFGSKSTVQWIRQKFSFHMDANLLEELYDELPNDFASIEYLSDRFVGHNLFNTPEMLSILGMIRDHKDRWLEQTEVLYPNPSRWASVW